MTTDGYIDGDDLCADCGRCCVDVQGLRVTEAELERVPLLKPRVVRESGPFRIVDMEGPCPYLTADKRCGTFETRPFDCSLYPAYVTSVGMRRPDGTVPARWSFGGAICPEREAMQQISRDKGLEQVRGWLTEVTGAERVELRRERPSVVRRLRRLARRAVALWPRRRPGSPD